MSSNVGQNYPYSSETEAERSAAVQAAIARFPALAEKVAAESTPLDDGDPPDRWWVWVCPEGDLSGRLHVAGWAGEHHAPYTVCDTCGKTFLR